MEKVNKQTKMRVNKNYITQYIIRTIIKMILILIIIIRNWAPAAEKTELMSVVRNILFVKIIL
jgi:hypothetical protein